MKRLSGLQKTLLAAVAVVVGLNLFSAVIGAFLPSPSGPASSSYATTPRGVAAYSALLDRDQEIVRVRESLTGASLDISGTVVVLEPDLLVPEEVEALGRFVRDGGRLVAGGLEAEALDSLLGDQAPELSASSSREFSATGGAASGGARRVTSAGRSSYSDPGGGRPVAGDRTRALVVTTGLGAGEAVLLADASPLQNRLLSSADNAALALGLVGDRRGPVQFVEAVHGYGDARGLRALPGSWKIALVGLALGLLLFVLSRARRLGPPDPPASEPPPARAAYVAALGEVLRRTNDTDAATAILRRNARELLSERHGPAAVVDAGALRASALRSGAREDEAAALAGEGGGEATLLAAGRGLGRLRERAGASGRQR